MPFTFKCPQCQKTLSAREENAGQKVRCPGCATIFPIPAPPTASQPVLSPLPAPPPAPAAQGDPFDFGAAQQSAARGEASRGFDWGRVDAAPDRPPLEPDWREVGRGLGMVRLGANFYAGALALFLLEFLLFLLIISSGGLNRVGLVLPCVGVIPLLLLLAGFIVAAVGAFRCAAIPASSGVKGLATAAAVCSVIPGVHFVGYVLFLLVLRSMATTLRLPGVATRALVLLIVFACTVAGWCLGNLAIVVLAVAAESTEVFQLGRLALAAVVLLVYLGLALWFVSLVGEVRNRITRSPIRDETDNEEDDED
jgi:phage FluMu protein Com